MSAETVAPTELTTAEAAALAGVSDRTIRNWIKDGRLSAHKVGETRRIHQYDLLAYLKVRAHAVSGILGRETIAETPPVTLPERTQDEGQGPEVTTDGAINPELINAVLQPLLTQLEQSERERRRLHDENLELAGRIGFYQGKMQQVEQKLLLLEAPKQAEQPDSEPERKPWWRRVFTSG